MCDQPPLLGPCAACAARCVDLHTGILVHPVLVPPTRGVGSPGWGRRGRGEATGGRPLWKAGVRKSGYAYVLIPGVRAARLRSPPPVTTRGQLADAGCRGTAALRTWRRAWSARHADGVRDGGVRKDGKSDTVHGWYARGIPALSHPPRHHSPLSHPNRFVAHRQPFLHGTGWQWRSVGGPAVPTDTTDADQRGGARANPLCGCARAHCARRRPLPQQSTPSPRPVSAAAVPSVLCIIFISSAVRLMVVPDPPHAAPSAPPPPPPPPHGGSTRVKKESACPTAAGLVIRCPSSGSTSSVTA